EDERLIVHCDDFKGVQTGGDIEMPVVAAELVDEADVPPVDVDECSTRFDIQLQPTHQSLRRGKGRSVNGRVDDHWRPEPGPIERHESKPKWPHTTRAARACESRRDHPCRAPNERAW